MTKPKLTAIEIEYKNKSYHRGFLGWRLNYATPHYKKPPCAVLNLAAKIDKIQNSTLAKYKSISIAKGKRK